MAFIVKMTQSVNLTKQERNQSKEPRNKTAMLEKKLWLGSRVKCCKSLQCRNDNIIAVGRESESQKIRLFLER